MPSNKLHTCLSVWEAWPLVDSTRNNAGTDAVKGLVNAKNESGQPVVQALMRTGKAGPVVEYLLGVPELDVNQPEDLTGMTIGHLCQNGAFMRKLVTRADFNPNAVNTVTGQSILAYGLTFGKHPDLTKALLEDKRLVINETEIYAIRASCTSDHSVQSLALVDAKLQQQRIQSFTPGFNASAANQPGFPPAAAAGVNNTTEYNLTCTLG